MSHSIEALVKLVDSYTQSDKGALLSKAYEFAKKAHDTQTRNSGEPYITHPLAVAHILAELKADPSTLAAALLHDVIEDTGITSAQLKKEFGKDITALVEGVSKLGHIHFGSKLDHQAENFRRMFLAMAQDIRVIIIKLADRLHNMRTLGSLPEEKQKRIAQETLDVYAPLAHRLGMGSVKWELEDLSFRYLNPVRFQEIKALVSDKRKKRESYVHKMIEQMEKILADNNIPAKIEGRAKHFYSINHKMEQQNLDFNDVYDLLAVRIVVESLQHCYAVMGLAHSLFKPVQGKFKDYIAMPKSNGYQSLHTTVIGVEGKPVEIQIRTAEMHKIAEQGIAAHWKYKQGDPQDSHMDERLSWLRQLITWQKEMTSATDFMQNLKVDLFADEVFVFTPKGDVHSLPRNATVLDFAYAIHTDIGHCTTGAKINSQMVPLDTKVANSDIVEILTSKKPHPSLDWLGVVSTHQAKSKIKAYFRKHSQEQNIKLGQESFENALRSILMEPAPYQNLAVLHEIFPRLNLQKVEDIYRGIAGGEYSAKTLAKRIKEFEENKNTTQSQIPENEGFKAEPAKPHPKGGPGVEVTEAAGVLIHLAKCCTPLPGDEIVGIVSRGHGVAVHRSVCHNCQGPEKHIVKVNWTHVPDRQFPANVEVHGFDRIGLLKDILNTIAETGTNISEANVKRKDSGGSMLANLVLEMRDTNHLASILQTIRRIPDVLEVYRK
jgi:GTP pyrophosphokinase